MKATRFTKSDVSGINFNIPYVYDEDNIGFNKTFPVGVNEQLNNRADEIINHSDFLQRQAISNIKDSLNDRELKILNWLQEGTGSNRKIAKVLDVGRMSVQRDKERIWDKIRTEYEKLSEDKEM